MHTTGPPNLTINKLLPLKSDFTKKYTATSKDKDIKPPPSNKHKAGNANIKNYYKVKPKQVIDITLNKAEKNVPTSSTVLALENIDIS